MVYYQVPVLASGSVPSVQFKEAKGVMCLSGDGRARLVPANSASERSESAVVSSKVITPTIRDL